MKLLGLYCSAFVKSTVLPRPRIRVPRSTWNVLGPDVSMNADLRAVAHKIRRIAFSKRNEFRGRRLVAAYQIHSQHAVLANWAPG